MIATRNLPHVINKLIDIKQKNIPKNYGKNVNQVHV